MPPYSSAMHNNEREELEDISEDDASTDTEYISNLTPGDNSETRLEDKKVTEQWKTVLGHLKTGDNRWEHLEHNMKHALLKRNLSAQWMPTLLHYFAQEPDHKSGLEKDLEKIVKFVLQHEQHVPNNYRQKSPDPPVLKQAMEASNYGFLATLMDCAKEVKKLSTLISATDDSGMNSIHYTLKMQLPAAWEAGEAKETNSTEYWRPKDIVKTLHKLVMNAPEEALVARDNDQNTPLHYALDYSLCLSANENYFTVVRNMVKLSENQFKRQPMSQFNKKGDSPYLHYLMSRSEFEKNIKTTPPAISDTGPLENNSKQGVQEIQVDKKHKDKMLNNFSSDPSKQANEKSSKMKDLPLKPGLAETDLERQKKAREPRLHDSNPDRPVNTGQYQRDNSRSRPYTSVHKDVLSQVEVPEADARRGSIVRPGISRRGTAINPPNIVAVETQPSCAKPQVVKNANVSQEGTKARDIATEIGEYLRIHYIRKKCDVEAKELIYGKASDKNLYFDATGYGGKPISGAIELIKALSDAGGFDDTLSYVSLPYFTDCHDKDQARKDTRRAPGANESRPRTGIAKEGSSTSCDKLVELFDTLVSAGVRRIIRLEVEERADCPHEDAAIERSIRGNDYFSLLKSRPESIVVEYWDWKKPDLGLDVISHAAPKVEHVNLYWSGNPVVLNGWSCSEEVKRHCRTLSELKGIKVKAFTFLKTERHKRPIISNPEPDDDAGAAGGTRGRPLEHQWINRMGEFRTALRSIHDIMGNAPYQQTRIALIDDGIDLSSLQTYNGIVKPRGMSYPLRDGPKELPWHQSTNKHGTLMANMIVHINPYVVLDVIRIEETTDGDNRSIYARSAAEAIEAAVHRKADIISMSWTIRKPEKKVSKEGSESIQTERRTADEIDIETLEKAIQKAKEEGTLMFCSASDNIVFRGVDNLPFSAAKDSIFRIGSATSLGQRDSATEDKKTISYFFPGNQVALPKDPRLGGEVELHDGSSVATALAAGLASLILHCTRLLAARNRPSAKTFTDWAEKLRRPEYMKRAFNGIHKDSSDDEKFLPVWDRFSEDCSAKIRRVTSKDAKLDILEQVMDGICRDFRNRS
ncbi:hypothetical protein FOXB_14754 [Fusarium oxysporum f. sp. conglutinans Fo5176]|uniref:Peptidase S8/S53 domain-containing protein n=1 Tax=Fusarium oxysporum (strain Fo5176) TaxID=660025 RepID=F9G7X2_FUSOF|nr:hypothetical protein FOXB_14754 [Fusarium oxysporum f. sp. conglutinans Fo5176]